ncbi:MAG: flagellar protein FlaG [Candidatus Hydrogenedentes bacterium]|nr:flagellar protein FlaG [Candidatus Hydrogenedentota bacterium]
MGVPSISVQELRISAVPPAAWARSGGGVESPPKEAAPAAREIRAVSGETQRPAPESFSDTTGVRLRVDRETNRIIAQIVDEDDNVIRQIPPEDALRIAAQTRELLGLLFDQSA